jgi:hypothetical protein
MYKRGGNMNLSFIVNAKGDFTRLRKDQIGEILGIDAREITKTKKDELLKKLNGKLDTNEILIKSIYKKYASEFSLHPIEVEELLNITKTERVRWTEERKLKVIGYSNFQKWGKINKYPLYDGYHTQTITEEKVGIWRLQHKTKQSKNRKAVAKKTTATKKKNESIQKAFYENEWKKMLTTWYRVDGQLGATLQLAFWTMWVSRWAKESQVKALNAKSKKNVYESDKRVFYEMKNEALQRLIKSPYSKLSFFIPENPDKITNIEFCSSHYNLWLQERDFEYISKWDFYHWHQKSINKCKCCTVEIVNDYYSLFYILIEYEELEDYHFSFHIPFPIGENFLPNKEKLPKVVHQEQEGLFRFGRSLLEEEKIIFKTKDVKKYYEEAKIKFDHYFSVPVPNTDSCNIKLDKNDIT